ncbi:phosphopantetheine-binding protein [Streptomyces sp. KL116D]|uniref:phosphopantetheine-binding protein n=1 Tax=Streptomyces sp. KL116D TaxID=3045152 RepID=UPI0035588ECB
MVPSAFVLMDEFPLQPSGKLDRTALPDPAAVRPELSGAYTEPSDLEQILAGIWAEVLEIDRVGATDDSLDLGGHSLLVTQVVSRIATCSGWTSRSAASSPRAPWSRWPAGCAPRPPRRAPTWTRWPS